MQQSSGSSPLKSPGLRRWPATDKRTTLEPCLCAAAKALDHRCRSGNAAPLSVNPAGDCQSNPQLLFGNRLAFAHNREGNCGISDSNIKATRRANSWFVDSRRTARASQADGATFNSGSDSAQADAPGIACLQMRQSASPFLLSHLHLQLFDRGRAVAGGQVA